MSIILYYTGRPYNLHCIVRSGNPSLLVKEDGGVEQRLTSSPTPLRCVKLTLLSIPSLLALDLGYKNS